MAGTWGMSDQEYVTANRRFRRRQLWINAGFTIGSVGQLWNYLAGNGGLLGLASGVGFGFCAVLGVLAWRRGLPDTRLEKDRAAEQ